MSKFEDRTSQIEQKAHRRPGPPGPNQPPHFDRLGRHSPIQAGRACL